MSATTTSELLDAARALSPLIRCQADAGERASRLPAPVLSAMTDLGLFRRQLPRAYDGLELDLPKALRVIEEVSAADGSAGWCVMIGAGGGAFSGWLEKDVASEIFVRDERVVVAGTFAASGRADVVRGGYRVTGRWAFASGCQHSAWLIGNCVVHERGEPRQLPSGSPETVMGFFPVRDTKNHRAVRRAGPARHRKP